MKILYEDSSIIIVEKPQGMPCQSDKTVDISLIDLVKKHTMLDVGIINRLDRPVGGVTIFGKTKKAVSILSEDIQSRNIEKKYIAVVVGDCKEYDLLEDYLLKNQRLNKSKVVFKNSPNSKFAKLSYKKIDKITVNNQQFSLIDINLETGRHHQIRVQLSNAGYGIWGDGKYNKRAKGIYENIGLWATQVSLTHPVTKKNITVKADLPNVEPFSYWQDLTS